MEYYKSLLSNGHMTDGGIDSWQQRDTTCCGGMSDFGNQHACTTIPRRAPMPSMHTITKMAQPKVASHKLKHGFSCSIISHELAERYGFHVCIPCQNFQDKQREVAAGMVRKNAVVDEQRGRFACDCRPHTRDFVRFRVLSG
jgi:hypothetical protein